MYQPEPDHELPYIKQAEREDAHEVAQEKAIDWLWDELRDDVVAENMSDDIDAWSGNFGKLVSLVADLKKCCARVDESSDQDVRAYMKAGLVQGFLNQSTTLIENAYAYHVQQRTEKELDHD